VLVYVGAVMVLFLFVVMMLDVSFDRIREAFWSNLLWALFVGICIVVEMSFVIITTFMIPEKKAPPITAVSNTRELGRLIFTDYVFAFEVAAAVLLVAIIAAVALTLRHRKDTKGQRPADQVRVRREDRVRLVTMPSETER